MSLLVFTDLDGTLLDHGSYSYAPALEALAALKARAVPLILASSKTAAEIAPLHEALGLGDAPAIVENGAGLYEPGKPAETANEYELIRATMNIVPQDIRRKFRGFGDMTVAEVVAATGLSEEGATLAKTRMFSEPGTFTGTWEEEEFFLRPLRNLGIHARRGGRFLTLSLGRTKADAMAEVIARYGQPTTIALGDAPNDAEMIEAAAYGVIIRNDHGTGLPRLPGETTGRVRRTEAPGPAGWNRAILDLLHDLP